MSGWPKDTLHGLTKNQYLELLEGQYFRCPLSGNEFVYSSEKKKFHDVNGKAPPVDHDHVSGFIRGILSEKVNWLERQWELGSYGILSKPPELTDYQEDPPAFQIIGRVPYL